MKKDLYLYISLISFCNTSGKVKSLLLLIILLYLKYKVFLETDNQSVTPNISDVRFSFATDCTPVGQAFVGGLNSSAYNLAISKPGYQTINYSGLLFNQPWQTIKVTLNPN